MDPKAGGSIERTATVGLSSASAIVVVDWLFMWSWPPPEAVVIILVGAAMPVLHLIGRGIWRRVAKWSGEDPATPTPQKDASP